MKPILVDNNAVDTIGLTQVANDSRAKRLIRSSTTYTSEEIVKIQTMQSRLFPPGYKLCLDDSNRLRALCTLSQAQLKPVTDITSHRPVLGPLIVALKKLSWPIIKVHLEQQFKGIAAFQALAVETLAKKIYELDQAKPAHKELPVKL